MKLLTKELLTRFRKTGNQSESDDAIVIAKFFTPRSYWTWYATEYDEETRQFFGIVYGFHKERGYFSLDELQSIKGEFGIGIERDRYFSPAPVSALPKFAT